MSPDDMNVEFSHEYRIETKSTYLVSIEPSHIWKLQHNTCQISSPPPPSAWPPQGALPPAVLVLILPGGSRRLVSQRNLPRCHYHTHREAFETSHGALLALADPWIEARDYRHEDQWVFGLRMLLVDSTRRLFHLYSDLLPVVCFQMHLMELWGNESSPAAA